MQRKNVIGVGVALLLLQAGCFMAYHYFFSPHLAYISNPEVFNGFILKKELETKLNRTKEERKKTIDSLMLNLQLLSKSTDPKDKKQVDKFDVFRQQYLSRKQELEQVNQSLEQQYTEQVWKQLDQYIKDYGQTHNYAFIYGTSGDGSVMYAKDKENITGAIIEYINKRYQGAAK